MMRCDDYQCMISALADGELSDSDRSRLEDHLAECAECRAIYEETCDLQSKLAESFLDCGDVPDLEPAVMGRILPRRRFSLNWAFAGAAAATVIVCILVRFVLWPIHGAKPGPEHIASQPPQQEHHTPVDSGDRNPAPNPPQVAPKPGHHEVKLHASVVVHSGRKAVHRIKPKHSVHPDSVKPSAQPAPVSVEQAVVAVEYVEDEAAQPVTQRMADINDLHLHELSPTYRTDGTLIMVMDTILGDQAAPRYEILTDKGDGSDSM